MRDPNLENAWDDDDEDWMTGEDVSGPSATVSERIGPTLTIVETAFLASTTALIWLVNTYVPTGPLLRMFFSLPVALACMRWNRRAGWMTAIVASLLLSVLMGPPRSIQYLLPYGVLGVVLGSCWKAKLSWYISMGWGICISAVGLVFQIALLSLLLSTNVWLYLNQQVTGILDWIFVKLNLLAAPTVLITQIFAGGLILLNALLYVLLVHLIASLLFERLNHPIPDPPKWLEVLLEE